jgi:hypothetical protein
VNPISRQGGAVASPPNAEQSGLGGGGKWGPHPRCFSLGDLGTHSLVQRRYPLTSTWAHTVHERIGLSLCAGLDSVESALALSERLELSQDAQSQSTRLPSRRASLFMKR